MHHHGSSRGRAAQLDFPTVRPGALRNLHEPPASHATALTLSTSLPYAIQTAIRASCLPSCHVLALHSNLTVFDRLADLPSIPAGLCLLTGRLLRFVSDWLPVRLIYHNHIHIRRSHPPDIPLFAEHAHFETAKTPRRTLVGVAATTLAILCSPLSTRHVDSHRTNPYNTQSAEASAPCELVRPLANDTSMRPLSVG